MNIWKMILTCLKHIELNNQKIKHHWKSLTLMQKKWLSTSLLFSLHLIYYLLLCKVIIYDFWRYIQGSRSFVWCYFNQIKVTVVNLLIGIYMQLPWYLMCYFFLCEIVCRKKKLHDLPFQQRFHSWFNVQRNQGFYCRGFCVFCFHLIALLFWS